MFSNKCYIQSEKDWNLSTVPFPWWNPFWCLPMHPNSMVQFWTPINYKVDETSIIWPISDHSWDLLHAWGNLNITRWMKPTLSPQNRSHASRIHSVMTKLPFSCTIGIYWSLKTELWKFLKHAMPKKHLDHSLAMVNLFTIPQPEFLKGCDFAIATTMPHLFILY